MSHDQQPYAGRPNASEMSHYGGVAYTPPERVESRLSDQIAPLSRWSLVWRLAVAGVLALLGVVDLIRFFVLLSSGSSANPALIVGSLALAVVFFLYPVSVAVKLRRGTL
ncbi:hypothetical protein VH571_09690 [Frondihabitans sp. 4ASC-45]|uniref:hypothetical protein n=1 Tax=Frondihabitans sp. 4ASC-45 TaxID=3111636 RepID=UPI003C1E6F8F